MNKICEHLIRGIVSRAGEEENCEIICYGILQGLHYVVFLGICTLMSILMGNGIKGVLFLIPFYFLRIYAGGYHAQTRFGCYLFSACILFIANLYLLHPFKSGYVCIVWCAIFCIHIWYTAPMETANKRLSRVETNVYGKKVRLILSSYLLVSLFAVIVEWGYLADMMFVSLLSSEILICRGLADKRFANIII